MNRLHTHYGGHVENLNAALKYNSLDDARTALACLHSDGIAQVMTYMNQRSFDNAALSIGAVSPQMKLDVNLLSGRHGSYQECVQVKIAQRSLVCCIDVTSPLKTTPALENPLWWAKHRGMAVRLDADNACSGVHALLSDDLKSRVETLHILVGDWTLCTHYDGPESETKAARCNGQCGTLLCALSTFPNLMRLSIRSVRAELNARVEAAVHRALFVTERMQLNEVKLLSFPLMHDFSTMPLPRHLRRLTAASCGIQSLAGLDVYSKLTHLDVSRNPALRSLNGIADAASLEKLVASYCGLQDVDGLSGCLWLRKVNVSGNGALRSLRGLAGTPRLETIVAKECGLQDVESLSQCSQLREIDVSCNRDLLSLRGLAGAPTLEKVVAKACRLQDLEGLSECSLLKEADVSWNGDLLSLRDLVDAARLEKVVAWGCVLQDEPDLRSRQMSDEVVLDFDGSDNSS